MIPRWKRIVLGTALITGQILGPAEAATDYLEDARRYLQKGELKAAAIQLKNLLQAEPAHVEGLLLLGEASFKLNDAEGAVRAFEKARQLKAPPSRWAVPLARGHLAVGSAQTLLDELQPTADLDAASRGNLLALRGMAWLAQGNRKAARDSFNAALETAPHCADAILGLASMDASDRKFDAAIDRAGEVVARDSRHPGAWTFIGEAKRMKGDLDGALEAFDKAADLEPADLRPLLGRASALLGLNRLDDAAAALERVRRAAGEVPQTLYLESVLLVQRQRLSEAEDLLSKLVQAHPDHFPAKLLLGNVAYQRGRFELARDQLARFLVSVPGHLPAVKLLASVHLKQGRAGDAVKVLRVAEDIGTDDPQFLSLLGSAYLQSQQYEMATEALRKAAELAPDAAGLKTQLALGRMATGRFDDAAGELKSALVLDQNLSQADVMLVLVQIQQKRFDEAIASAEKLKAKLPDDPMPDNLLGAAYMAKGDFAKAEEYWKAALKAKPGYASPALNLAKLALRRKDGATAAEYLENLLVHDAGNADALTALAEIAEGRKDFAGAEQYLLKARQHSPQNIHPALMLSAFYLRQGKPVPAIEVAEETAAEYPDQPKVLQFLAEAQSANAQKDRAIASLRKAVQVAPEDPEARHRLAHALQDAGNREGAVAEWQLLTERFPQYEPAYLAEAEALLQERRFDEVLKLADRVKAQMPHSPAGMQIEGDAYFARKQFARAESAYGAAAKTGLNASLVRRLFHTRWAADQRESALKGLQQWLRSEPGDGDGWMLLAQGLQETGRAREAVAAYEKVMKERGETPMLLNNLAFLYQETGDSRAMTTAEKLRLAGELAPEALDTVGWIFTENGRPAEALPLLRDAVTQAPQISLIRIHLAQALADLGRKDEAREELETLLKDGKSIPERRKAEELLKKL